MIAQQPVEQRRKEGEADYGSHQKDAEHGCLFFTPESHFSAPAYPLESVHDPTGAGDAYRAGLIKGLIQGLPWATAAHMGAILASFAVEQQGTQEHQLELADFWERYTENFGPPPVIEK